MHSGCSWVNRLTSVGTSPPLADGGSEMPLMSRSVSWAGAFWVLMSEMFSMSAKSPAVSAATAMLFLAGILLCSVSLMLPSGVQCIAASVCHAGYHVAPVQFGPMGVHPLPGAACGRQARQRT